MQRRFGMYGLIRIFACSHFASCPKFLGGHLFSNKLHSRLRGHDVRLSGMKSQYPLFTITAIFLCLFAFSGCMSIAPGYTRPEAPVPAVWPDGPAYKEGADKPGDLSAADIAWRDFFIYERLQKVIGLALMDNRDLRLAMLNIEKARALYRIQRAELLPTVNAGATFSKERVPGI
jgi:multidrug efflux system outer membrane protein